MGLMFTIAGKPGVFEGEMEDLIGAPGQPGPAGPPGMPVSCSYYTVVLTELLYPRYTKYIGGI